MIQNEKRFEALTGEEIHKYEMEVLKKVADLALIPPVLNTSPLPDYDYDRLDYGMNVSIERTAQGRLWSLWVAGGDSPKAFMVMAKSDDNGESWSKPCLVIDSHSNNLPLDRTVIVGCLWTDPLGRLWLFFDQVMHHFDGRGGLWFARCDNPEDQDPLWSKPQRIWDGSMINKPVVLSSGEWLLPIQLLQHSKGFGPFAHSDIFDELDPYRGANIFITRDQGVTFERLGNVTLPSPDWSEHMIIERNDRSLWMLARTQIGILESFSLDRGVTWSVPALPNEIRQPAARFHIRRLLSGRLLMVKHGDTINDPTQIRHKLKAFLSEDEGNTWKGGLMLDSREGVSYPDVGLAPDGTIYISYDFKRDTHGHILMARIKEDDILAGELICPGSRLSMLICKPMKERSEQIN
ncbi:exo-alpha-sialidase [Paenibacillus sp. LMG 31461]|uniref:Exo-alpha-sialidase n=1 Tax=Paenibacillus plantarum TaxID=2654975 RepID=A0ABX1XC73_9BACL|nr:sialidase family protein [Paenibacillus plantarum]NOU66075.1 exo-alpha-sialidase [Paenibacillus plantarum]